MGLLASLLVVVGYPTETQYFTVVALRNVAAADAARAVNAYAAGRRLHAVATADSVANRVRVEGDAAPIRQVSALLADLDQPLPQAVCQMLMVQVPAGFADQVGLGLFQHNACTLTAREVRMLIAAIGQAKRVGVAGVDILSRPTLTVVDNQTGSFEVGGPNDYRLLARVTERTAEDGKTLMRAEIRLTVPVSGHGASGQTTHESQATAALESGGGLVIRTLVGAADDGRPNEFLWLVSVSRVKTETGGR